MSSFIFNNNEKAPANKPQQVETHQSVTFWQSPLWIDILTKTHQAELIIASQGETKIVIERRKIWKQYTGLYILGVDPALIDGNFVRALQEEVITSHDLFLQIEPIGQYEGAQFSFELFQGNKAPFRRFIEPVTALVDITLAEEAILPNFAEKGRYNIRLAQKRGIKTKWVKGCDICHGKSYLEAFFDLLDETTKRDGFAHNSLAYYKHFVETLESHNAGGLLVAEKDGILHAAGIFAYWGDTAIYYYGASSSDTTIRRDMATYLLQWDAIREGIKRGCRIYDFLGISPDGKGKLAGVTEFKLRFNPEKKYWPGERIIVYKPITLFFLRSVSKLRKLFR